MPSIMQKSVTFVLVILCTIENSFGLVRLPLQLQLNSNSVFVKRDTGLESEVKSWKDSSQHILGEYSGTWDEVSDRGHRQKMKVPRSTVF
jgi:hypothetical protein